MIENEYIGQSINLTCDITNVWSNIMILENGKYAVLKPEQQYIDEVKQSNNVLDQEGNIIDTAITIIRPALSSIFGFTEEEVEMTQSEGM